jgi:hypothetical protein
MYWVQSVEGGHLQMLAQHEGGMLLWLCWIVNNVEPTCCSAHAACIAAGQPETLDLCVQPDCMCCQLLYLSLHARPVSVLGVGRWCQLYAACVSGCDGKAMHAVACTFSP